jgi:hypothetical protein
MYQFRVLVKAGHDQGKTDVILSPSSGPTDHLVKICCREVGEFMPVITVTLD